MDFRLGGVWGLKGQRSWLFERKTNLTKGDPKTFHVDFPMVVSVKNFS